MVAVLQFGCGGSDESGGGGSGSGGSGATSGSAGTGGTGGTGTGGTGASAGSGGFAGSDSCPITGAAGSTGKLCGGKGGAQCDLGEYCDYPDDSCGTTDQIGECKAPPTCGISCSAVCGCNGLSYFDRCNANLQGVDVVADKSCVPGNGGEGASCFGDPDCQTGFKCCKSCGAIGCPQACTQIATGGSCPALP
jgi:hypothetical protein